MITRETRTQNKSVYYVRACPSDPCDPSATKITTTKCTRVQILSITNGAVFIFFCCILVRCVLVTCMLYLVYSYYFWICVLIKVLWTPEKKHIELKRIKYVWCANDTELNFTHRMTENIFLLLSCHNHRRFSLVSTLSLPSPSLSLSPYLPNSHLLGLPLSLSLCSFLNLIHSNHAETKKVRTQNVYFLGQSTRLTVRSIQCICMNYVLSIHLCTLLMVIQLPIFANRSFIDISIHKVAIDVPNVTCLNFSSNKVVISIVCPLSPYLPPRSLSLSFSRSLFFRPFSPHTHARAIFILGSIITIVNHLSCVFSTYPHTNIFYARLMYMYTHNIHAA